MTQDHAHPARTQRADDDELQSAARARWRLALVLTVLMCAVYFGFILLVAFDKPLLAEQVLAPGLTLGILLGAIVIVSACALTGVYAWWANRHDVRLARLRK